MLPQEDSYYKLTDKKTLRTLDDIFKLCKGNNCVLIGGMAVALYSYLSKDIYYLKRRTKDIDLAAPKEDEQKIKEILYTRPLEGKITEGNIFGHRGIKIESRDYVPVSILFREEKIPYKEIKFKYKNRTFKLEVAREEYLLVDKIFTYLRRGEQKDIEDIEALVNIMKKKGYDKELLENTFNIYSDRYRKYAEIARDLLNNFLYSNNGRTFSKGYSR